MTIQYHDRTYQVTTESELLALLLWLRNVAA